MKNLNNITHKNYCDAHHPVIGAIDLGTNSCRLLVASVNIAALKKTPFRSKPNFLAWKKIDSFGRIVRLGEGIYKNNILSDDAIERALEALRVCKKKIDFYRVSSLRAVATEACRRAENAHVLAERALQELDINIEIISSEEEARLALTGCVAVLNYKTEHAIFFDIGGGSTELVWVKIISNGRKRPGYPLPFEVIDSISIPFGVVTASEKYEDSSFGINEHNEISKKIASSVQDFVKRNNIEDYIKKHSVQLFGSSGTVTTLSAVHLGLEKYTRYAVDGYDFAISDLYKIMKNIMTMSQDERLAHPCIGGGREDLVLVGAAILEGICSSIPIDKLRVADRGVREGILSEMLSNINKIV